jgi:hypothetical protein
MVNCDKKKLIKNKEALDLVINAQREGFNALKQLGYNIQPKSLKKMTKLPNFLLRGLYKKLLRSDLSDIALVKHALAAPDELVPLSRGFKQICMPSGLQMPCFDELLQHAEKYYASHS